jgi:hypothetical protein
LLLLGLIVVDAVNDAESRLVRINLLEKLTKHITERLDVSNTDLGDIIMLKLRSNDRLPRSCAMRLVMRVCRGGGANTVVPVRMTATEEHYRIEPFCTT